MEGAPSEITPKGNWVKHLSGLSNDDPGSQAEDEAPNPGPSLASIPDNSLGTFRHKNSATNLKQNDILTTCLNYR